MKIIKIKTQKQFDDLPDTFPEFTMITIVGNIDKIKSTPKNSYLQICENAKIGSILETVKIYYILDNVKIGHIGDNVEIDYIGGYTEIDFIYENVKIDFIADSVKINHDLREVKKC